MTQQTENVQATPLPVAALENLDLSLEGELNIGDYVESAPLSRKTAQELKRVLEVHKEKTRTKIALRLVTMFGCILGGTYLLTAVAAFYPSADRAFIKDISSQATTPLVGLLGAALGYYFGAAKDE